MARRQRGGHARGRRERGGGVNVDALLEAALAIKVTNKILRQLQEEFGVQLLRERLSGGQGQWLMRYGEASQALLEEHVLDGLRAELGKLDSETFHDATAFQKKIEHATTRLSLAEQELLRSSHLLLQTGMELEEWFQHKQGVQWQVNNLILSLHQHAKVSDGAAKLRLTEGEQKEPDAKPSAAAPAPAAAAPAVAADGGAPAAPPPPPPPVERKPAASGGAGPRTHPGFAAPSRSPSA